MCDAEAICCQYLQVIPTNVCWLAAVLSVFSESVAGCGHFQRLRN